MGYNLISVLKDISTKIGNIVVHDPGTNIDGVATAITNKTIPDPNTELANITSALNNLSGMFGGKYYTKYIGPYSTSGNWRNYTQNVIQFNDLPHAAVGPGKTFMFIHSFRLEGTLNTNIESYLELPFGGTLWNPRHYTHATNYVWQTFNHIAFITADNIPIIRINVATSAAATNMCNSYCALVPLN